MEHTCWDFFCQLTPPNLMIGCASKTGESLSVHVSLSCNYISVIVCVPMYRNVFRIRTSQFTVISVTDWLCIVEIRLLSFLGHHKDTKWTPRLRQQPTTIQNISKNSYIFFSFTLFSSMQCAIFVSLLQGFFVLDQETLEGLSFLSLRM